MKNDAIALGILAGMISKKHTVQLNYFGQEVEITVFKNGGKDHQHYQGKSLIEAIMKADKSMRKANKDV